MVVFHGVSQKKTVNDRQQEILLIHSSSVRRGQSRPNVLFCCYGR